MLYLSKVYTRSFHISVFLSSLPLSIFFCSQLCSSVPFGYAMATWYSSQRETARLQTQGCLFKTVSFSLSEAIPLWSDLYTDVCLCFWLFSWDHILERVFSKCFQRQFCLLVTTSVLLSGIYLVLVNLMMQREPLSEKKAELMEISVDVPVYHPRPPRSNLGNLEIPFLVLLQRDALAGLTAERINKLLRPDCSGAHPSPAGLLSVVEWHRCPLVPVWWKHGASGVRSTAWDTQVSAGNELRGSHVLHYQ